MMYYLDSNAFARNCIPVVLYNDIWRMSYCWGNPMAQHEAGRLASEVIEVARDNILKMLNAPEGSNLLFTSTVTEANLWACTILNNTRSHVKTSKFEHKSVYDAIDNIGMSRSCDITDGIENGAFIYVQNECGIIQDIDSIRKNTKGLLFSDISQAVGNIKVDLTALNLDLATFGAYKFGGPVGVGCLYIKDMSNYVSFGSDNRYTLDAPGTPNTLAIYLASIALKYRLENLNEASKNSTEFQKTLEYGLSDLGFYIVGDEFKRINTTTYVYFGKKSNDLLLGLSDRGVIVGAGSACGSLEPRPSKVMDYLGFEGYFTDEFIRISQRGEYGSEDANKILSIITETLKEI